MKIVTAVLLFLFVSCVDTNTVSANERDRDGEWYVQGNISRPIAISGPVDSGNWRGSGHFNNSIRPTPIFLGGIGVGCRLKNPHGLPFNFSLELAADAVKFETRWNCNIGKSGKNKCANELKDGNLGLYSFGPRVAIDVPIGNNGWSLGAALSIGATYVDTHALVGPTAGHSIVPSFSVAPFVAWRSGQWETSVGYSWLFLPRFKQQNDEDVPGKTTLDPTVTTLSFRIKYFF